MGGSDTNETESGELPSSTTATTTTTPLGAQVLDAEDATVQKRKKSSKRKHHHHHHHRHDDDEAMGTGGIGGGDDEADPESSVAASASSTSSSFSTSLPPQLILMLDRAKRVRLELRTVMNKFISSYNNNEAFKQKVQIGLLVLATCVVLALQFSSVMRRGGGRGGGGRHHRALNDLGSSAGGSDADEANQPIVKDELGHIIKEVQRTKLQFENEEDPNLDVSGSDLLSVRRRYASRSENEAAQKKRAARVEKKCLRFPATVRREDSGPLSYYMPHKVFDLAVLQRSLKRLNFELVSDLKEAILVLKGVPRVTFRQLKEGKQYIDMVGSLSRIGSKKKTQLATLRNHVKKFSCTFESLGVQPRSWDMNHHSECKAFFDEHEDKGRMIVFKSCRPGEGSKGAGITVTDDLSEYREQWGKCEPNAFNFVAQHYIEKPLLIKNRKFDMRVYIFVANTQPYIVFFNPGYIRRSLADYKPTSTEKNDVLTNYHVQVTRTDFSPAEALWSFSQFMDYLKAEKLCKACGDVEMQLAKIARLVFDAGREYYMRRAGSFQIVGLDFMIDAYLRPLFIEGNVSPGLGSHGLKWKSQLMDDLVGMMYEQTMLLHERPEEFDLVPGDRIYGPNDNYWQLLVHEALENCDKKYAFDPCKELKDPWRPWV